MRKVNIKSATRAKNTEINFSSHNYIGILFLKIEIVSQAKSLVLCYIRVNKLHSTLLKS